MKDLDELEELVALGTAATDQVQHRVDDRVQHAHAEAADESAQEVDAEAEDAGKVGK